MKTKPRKRPVHPGEVLREEFLVPLSLSSSKLAEWVRVPANRISELVAERRGMTADTALRLERALGSSAYFWMNLQKTFELRVAENELGLALKKIKRLSTRIVRGKYEPSGESR